MAREHQTKDWSEYPIGTRAHACTGGHWIKVVRGWQWCTGAIFPTPGGDAVGACVELPDTQEGPDDDGDFDPSPYCSHCGAMKKNVCSCGPIPDND